MLGIFIYNNINSNVFEFISFYKNNLIIKNN